MFKVFKTSGIEGNYSISSYPLFVSNNCWAVYPAKHKTTKKTCSVWQFQKKEWENRLSSEGVINKNNKQLVMNDIYDNIKLFIGNQSKFKHPNFVTVIEPLEDHKNRILFVTENVIGDLYSTNKSELDEIMITRGLLQVCNGIKFLHESVRTVDLSIDPSSIMITEDYDWKLCGLAFIENITNGVVEKYIDPIDPRMPTFLSIDFRFTNPNLLLNHKVDYIDDLFSICCLIYFLFNDGQMLIKCAPCSSVADYERNINKLNQILKSLSNSNINHKHALFQKIPDNFYSTFINVLKNCQETNTDVIQLKQNVTIDDIMSSEIFNNKLIQILNSLDEFTTYANDEKIDYLKTLKSQVEKFSKTLLINKFIPLLINCVDITQFKKNKKPDPETEELIVECCENLLILSKSLSQLTFTDKVFPFILAILKKIPFDGFKILLLKNLTTIQNGLNASVDTNTNNEVFQKFSLDLFEKCIDDQNSMIVQELTLMYVKTVLEFQQYSTITNNILPKLCTLYSTTTSLKVKTLTITTFKIMIADLDKKALDDFLIIDKILPLIYNTSSAIYSNVKFTKNIISLYQTIYNKLSKSTSKSFNINGAEKELYDIIMELGFNIWKISKFITNKEDLNSSYETWGVIESFLKRELDSRVVSRMPSSNSTPVVYPSEFSVANKIEPKASPMQSILESKSYFSTNPTNTTNARDITKTANAADATNSKLSFGQTTVPKSMTTTATPASSNTTIDWSRAGTFGVMQPTNRKSDAMKSEPVKVEQKLPAFKLPNSNNSGSGISGGYGMMSVMTPTKIGQTAKLDNGDDEWSGFEVGSTTTKNAWENSLI